jgi:hypothetical protein
LYWVLSPQKAYNRMQLLVSSFFKHSHHFDYWNRHLNMCIHTWYLGCHESWSWTMLLPSGTCRKPITSITAVLLPFVDYLLTVSCT